MINVSLKSINKKLKEIEEFVKHIFTIGSYFLAFILIIVLIVDWYFSKNPNSLPIAGTIIAAIIYVSYKLRK